MSKKKIAIICIIIAIILLILWLFIGNKKKENNSVSNQWSTMTAPQNTPTAVLNSVIPFTDDNKNKDIEKYLPVSKLNPIEDIPTEINDTVIGDIINSLPKNSSVSIDKVVQGRLVTSYISDTKEDGNKYTPAVIMAMRLFDTGEGFPKSELEAKTAIQNYSQPFLGVDNVWDETDKFFVRRVLMYDNETNSAVVSYTFIPKEISGDPNMYMMYFSESDGYPLTEKVYKSVMDSLWQRTGICTLDNQSFMDTKEQLLKISIYKAGNDLKASDSMIKRYENEFARKKAELHKEYGVETEEDKLYLPQESVEQTTQETENYEESYSEETYNENYEEDLSQEENVSEENVNPEESETTVVEDNNILSSGHSNQESFNIE